MTHIFRHPKHYKELRAERRKLQAKLQASSKPEPSSGSKASSGKPQASSDKLQT